VCLIIRDKWREYLCCLGCLKKNYQCDDKMAWIMKCLLNSITSASLIIYKLFSHVNKFNVLVVDTC
jgi:hypothetical protein